MSNNTNCGQEKQEESSKASKKVGIYELRITKRGCNNWINQSLKLLWFMSILHSKEYQ